MAVPVLGAIRQVAFGGADFVREAWLTDRRRRFDRLHLQRRWDFDHPLEQQRHAMALAGVTRLLGPPPWERVLGLGCSEGSFTEQLAGRAKYVVATDVSPIACDRTRDRLAGVSNVAVQCFDLVRTAPKGRYPVVFALDILECIRGPRNVRRAARHVAGAVAAGGVLAVSDCLQTAWSRQGRWNRWLLEGGEALVEYLDGLDGLRLADRCYHRAGGPDAAWYPDHVIALYQKT